MFTISNCEYGCIDPCESKVHGNEITAALTKRSVTDDKLAAFIAKKCRNFAEISDSSGRSALHLACSVGRYAIAEWLLNHGAIINCKDLESSHTPLHRSLFYGCVDCAVLLMRYGANVEEIDKDDKTPLELICKYNELKMYKEVPQCTEIRVWRANRYYTVGVDSEEPYILPQCLDVFRKQGIRITNMDMSSYGDGDLCIVNHGNGGRLEIYNKTCHTTSRDSESSLNQKDLKKIVKISCSKNHTLFLSNTNVVYACGVNTDYQLGIIPIVDQSTVIKEVAGLPDVNSEEIVNILAMDLYSLAYTKHEIYVWGANRGQCYLNTHMQHLFVPEMILQVIHHTIKLVTASASAIACYTDDERIVLLHNSERTWIPSPDRDPLVFISLSEGKKKKDKYEMRGANIKLLTLSAKSQIHIWFSRREQYFQCIYSIPDHTRIDKLIYERGKMAILSEGDVFVGQVTLENLRCMKQNTVYRYFDIWDSSSEEEVSESRKIEIDFKKLHNVDRAVDIFAAEDLKSFVIMQEHPRKYFVIPQMPKEEYNFNNLLNEASEDDIVHDIKFHVDNEVFPAHKFIVFSRSKGLIDIVSHSNDINIHLNLTGLSVKMFKLILKFIYSNYLISKEDLDDMLQSMGPSVESERLVILNIFKEFVIKFELDELSNFLNRFDEDIQCFPQNQKVHFSPLTRTMFPDLYDVVIKCANNQEIHAHKCVLVARLEYFKLMFNSSWAETKEINLITIPIEYMGPIIDFMYTLDANHFKEQKYSEDFLYNMIVLCDQFFFDRLRKVCEVLLLEKVSISIQNCVEMLEFAYSYSCKVLEKSCLEFICQNLARMLDQHSLDSCQPKILAKINNFYHDTFKDKMDFRVITPKPHCISDKKLNEFVTDFKVDLKSKMQNGKVSPKTIVNILVQSKRNYEKEAISWLKQMSLDADEQTPSTSTTDIRVEVTDKWLKIPKKKHVKKRGISTPIKIDQTMQKEKKSTERFKKLNNANKNAKLSSKIVDSEYTIDEYEGGTPDPIVSLIDFMKTENLSKKQRKQLLPEREDEMAIGLCSPRKPSYISQSTEKKQNDFINVWESPIQSFAEVMKSPTTSSKNSTIKALHGVQTYETSSRHVASDSTSSSTSTPPFEYLQRRNFRRF